MYTWHLGVLTITRWVWELEEEFQHFMELGNLSHFLVSTFSVYSEALYHTIKTEPTPGF